MRESARSARRLLAVSAVAAGCLVGLAACGGGDSNELVVAGAASLEMALNDYVDAAGIDARMSFAGSDQLAAQIRQGVTPDVYAAADTTLPDQLFKEGLVAKPTLFATNSLVLAVPEGSRIDSLDDLTEPGTTIAVGDPAVPVGSYTREVLGGLPANQRRAIDDNVRSREPDVGSIVGKLTQGAVDAGFVYVTDVIASGGELRAVELPSGLQPDIAYAAAAVLGAQNPDGAREFIEGLLGGDGASALKRNGFKPPPGR
jgi:molybdate transport system substrate-binding protein